MGFIEMGNEYKKGQVVYVMCEGRMVPAEYIKRRGNFHEVFVKSRYFIEDEYTHFEREFERE